MTSCEKYSKPYVKLAIQKGAVEMNKIKAYRRAAGISQEALADAMDVTRQTIISLEKGKYTASLNLAYKLAQYFETTIEDVFFNQSDIHKKG